MSEHHRNQCAPGRKRVTHIPGGYIPEAQMAAELNLRPRTLRKWRAQGKGPPFIKIGRRVFYRDTSRAAWLQSQEIQPVRASITVEHTQEQERLQR